MKKIFFSLALFLLASCFKVPEELVMPGWDTNLNLPLTNRTYTLGDIVKQNDNIRIDTVGGKEIFFISSDSMKYFFGLREYLRNRLDQGFGELELILLNGDAEIEATLTNGIELDSANFTQGELIIDIINTGSSPIEFEVTFPDLFKSDGNNFKIKSSVPANGKSSSNLDLSGCSYSSYLISDKNKIKIKGKLLSGAGINLVKLNVSIRNSDFKYISGKLTSTDISQIHGIFEIPITSALEKFRGKFTANSAVLTIEAEYRTMLKNPFEVQVKNIEVMGKRNDGTTKYLESNNGDRNLGEILIKKEKNNRTFSNSNSNLGDLLTFLPDSFFLTADVTVNPQNKRGEASTSDSVNILLTLNSTGEMSFHNIPYTDSVNLNFSEDNRKAIRDGKEAILYLEITNAIPLAVDFDIVFADSLGNILFSKKSFVEASEVDNSGKTSIPRESISQITLDSAEIQNVARSDKVIYNLTLSTSGNGKKVSLQPSDWIKLLTYFKLKYHVKFE